MTGLVTELAATASPPQRFPSPFAVPPHPLARAAAHALLAELPRLGVDLAALRAPGGGKMFGVLVVCASDGTLGYLRAFSGMLGGAWHVDGFAPPLFDVVARDAMWPAGQDALREHELALRALRADPAYTGALADLRSFDRELVGDVEALRTRHRERREARKAARTATADLATRHALDQESRVDTAERKRAGAERAAERAAIVARIAGFDARIAAIERARADESRVLMTQVHDHYAIHSARGETRPLRALFAPGEPPGGAGDCAAPKLLGAAYRLGLAPLAIAEVWVGAPPATGGRHEGAFYPACRGKCGPILPFMLDGLAHDPIVDPGGAPIAGAEPRVVLEDAHVVIVDKPVGLLSVPGRSGALRDSVQTRLRARYPGATGPLVVHRLDLDTSGLLIAAKSAAVHTQLQAMFARREIAKTYVAIVDGDVQGDAGTIALPLRVDLDDRPRQIVDDTHGKPAVTAWRVVAREERRTRVELAPLTGRTHQLRVHCAYRFGLDAPIVGDRLYGAPDSQHAPRLLLHAERLVFVHPVSGETVDAVSKAPF